MNDVDKKWKKGKFSLSKKLWFSKFKISSDRLDEQGNIEWKEKISSVILAIQRYADNII
jgi:hypothetical protein